MVYWLIIYQVGQHNASGSKQIILKFLLYFISSCKFGKNKNDIHQECDSFAFYFNHLNVFSKCRHFIFILSPQKH